MNSININDFDLDALRERQRAAWSAGRRLLVESFVAEMSALPQATDALLDLIYSEVRLREGQGETPSSAEYEQRFPQLSERIRKLFEVHSAMRSRQDGGSVETHSIAAQGTDDATVSYHPDSPSTSDVMLASEATVRGTPPATGEQQPKDPRPIQRLGRFELIERVGQGAFGTVWRARDTELKRDVAIKVPRQGLLDVEEQEQFLREARAAAQLKHPHIVAIHEVGRQDDTIYIVSDFIRGETLADRMKDQRQTIPEAIQLCITIAEALQHAHTAGVIHRDLKPGNIMLDADRKPHVMDFGLAKRDAADASVSIEGRILGTPAYMSPEQARGDSHRADRRSDVYSLGVILFELLTGERPFRGEVRMLLQQILTDEAPSPRILNAAIPRDLETICLKCLQKEPSRRYASAAELAAELQRFLRHEPILARPIGRTERAWRWVKRNPVAAGLLASLVVLVGVLAMATVMIGGAYQRESESALREKESAFREKNARIDIEIKQKEKDAAQRKADEAALQEHIAKDKALFEAAKHTFTAAMAKRDQGQSTHALLLLAETLKQLEVVQPVGDRPRTGVYVDAINWSQAVREHLAFIVLERSANPTSFFQQKDLLYHVAFSPDGMKLATASLDNTAQIWDAATGKSLGQPLTHQGAVYYATFNPDGTKLATASKDGTARLWDVATAKSLGEPLWHRDEVLNVVFSSDGTKLATASSDKTARLWDAATGNPVGEPLTHQGPVYHVAFSPDGIKLATSAEDKTAQLWDVATGTPLGEPLTLQDAAVNHIAFSPDATKLATASEDTTARLWDVATRKPLGEPLRHQEAVRRVAFSPDGTKLVTASDDKTARLWDVATRKPLGEPLIIQGIVRHVAFSPDGTKLATVSGDTTARMWAVATRKPPGEPLRHQGGVIHLAFSPDGTKLATASGDKTARLWDVATGKPLGQPLQHQRAVAHVAFSPDGTKLATASDDKTARLWDAATSKPIGEPLTHKEGVHYVAFSPDGTKLVTASADGTARLWDVATGKPLGDPLEHKEGVNHVAFSPDGAKLATASYDGTARMWDAATGKPLGEPLKHQHVVPYVAFSPDGSKLATASWDKTARLWDVATSKPLGEPLQHQGNVESLAFSPDGTKLATASWDETARLWDVATSKPIGEPLTHQGSVNHVAFSPDGTMLATASGDKTARLWDMATTGKSLGEPLTHQGIVRHVAFSPDGTKLATASEDKTARLWDVETCKISGSADYIHLWIETLTAAELREGQLINLDADKFLKKRKQLDDLGGPPRAYLNAMNRRRQLAEEQSTVATKNPTTNK